jgi:hypothetical protein
MCDGPCTHELERSEYRFPDRLPDTRPGFPGPEIPEPKPKVNKRGRRPEHHAPEGPEEDRMIKPSEDRDDAA